MLMVLISKFIIVVFIEKYGEYMHPGSLLADVSEEELA